MEKLQTLEELRTRKEVKDYFKQLGKEITEKELDALKQSYDKAQESNEGLTLQQLDDVAGGFVFAFYVAKSADAAKLDISVKRSCPKGLLCYCDENVVIHLAFYPNANQGEVIGKLHAYGSDGDCHATKAYRIREHDSKLYENVKTVIDRDNFPSTLEVVKEVSDQESLKVKDLAFETISRAFKQDSIDEFSVPGWEDRPLNSFRLPIGKDEEDGIC